RLRYPKRCWACASGPPALDILTSCPPPPPSLPSPPASRSGCRGNCGSCIHEYRSKLRVFVSRNTFRVAFGLELQHFDEIRIFQNENVLVLILKMVSASVLYAFLVIDRSTHNKTHFAAFVRESRRKLGELGSLNIGRIVFALEEHDWAQDVVSKWQ